MKRHIFLIASFAAIVAFHIFLVLHNGYIKTWWADILLHSLGSAWLVWFYVSVRKPAQFSHTIVFVFFVGLLWETLEFFIDSPFFGGVAHADDPIWLLNTIFDLLVDAGAGILAWMFRSLYNTSNV